MDSRCTSRQQAGPKTLIPGRMSHGIPYYANNQLGNGRCLPGCHPLLSPQRFRWCCHHKDGDQRLGPKPTPRNNPELTPVVRSSLPTSRFITLRYIQGLWFPALKVDDYLMDDHGLGESSSLAALRELKQCELVTNNHTIQRSLSRSHEALRETSRHYHCASVSR